jgi:flagellar basal body L-ring protein FlgH
MSDTYNGGTPTPVDLAEAPKQANPAFKLTAEQLQTLFDGAPVSPGDTVTIVLEAQQPDEIGNQDFTVVEATNSADEGMGTLPPPEEPSETDPDEMDAIGYDRSALDSERKKKANTPKISAKDLTY